MSVNSLYVTGVAGDTKKYSFANSGKSMQWHAEVCQIKRHIRNINDNLARVGRCGCGELHDYEEWIEEVRDFISHWGKAFVPNDIRRALNGVERGVGISVTQFD